jgi:hypothetical protein
VYHVVLLVYRFGSLQFSLLEAHTFLVYGGSALLFSTASASVPHATASIVALHCACSALTCLGLLRMAAPPMIGTLLAVGSGCLRLQGYSELSQVYVKVAVNQSLLVPC